MSAPTNHTCARKPCTCRGDQRAEEIARELAAPVWRQMLCVCFAIAGLVLAVAVLG